MTISDLIQQVGDDNIGVQNLDDDATACNLNGDVGSFTFNTDPKFVRERVPGQTPQHMGLVLWMPAERVRSIEALPAPSLAARLASVEAERDRYKTAHARVEEGLVDAINAVSSGTLAHFGDHTGRSCQVGTTRLNEWRAALALARDHINGHEPVAPEVGAP
ncbi:MAG: hypothetical protein AAF845_05625 [Bacteroidota bacterium]